MNISSKGKELLLKSAVIMDGIASNHYDQTQFFGHEVEKLESSHADFRVDLPEDFCGTAACWLGHCALSPEIPELFLSKPLGFINPRIVCESGKTYEDAVVEVFGISMDHACALTHLNAAQRGGFYLWAIGAGGDRREEASPKEVGQALRLYVSTDGLVMDEYLTDRYG